MGNKYYVYVIMADGEPLHLPQASEEELKEMEKSIKSGKTKWIGGDDVYVNLDHVQFIKFVEIGKEQDGTPHPLPVSRITNLF